MTPRTRRRASFRHVAALGLLAAAWGTDAAAAAPDIAVLVAHGGNGVPACVACHGNAGEGQPAAGFPRLSGQGRAYLERQLHAFRDGTRASAVMGPIARSLDDATIAGLAGYYASLRALPATAVAPTAPVLAAMLAHGRRLAEDGDWDRDVPACRDCHGATLAGIAPTFPAIGGQNAMYTAAQLRAWQSGARAGDPQGLMKAVASRLTSADIDAVAAWLEGVGPAGTSTTPIAAAPAPARANAPRSTHPAPPLASIPEPDHGQHDTTVAAHTTAIAFTPPAPDAIPDNELGNVIRQGRAIFVDTQANAAQYVGNGLNCVNCHLDAGRKAGSAPLWAAYVKYPAYRSKNGKVNSYEDRLAGCFTFSMNGRVPAYDSPEMIALVTYSYWMAQGAPTGADLAGRGFPALAKPPLPPDAARGAHVFAQQCALCHGADGQGTQAGAGYAFPPLWGPRSYNAGAGMSGVDTAAAFVAANMPYGNPRTLSVQDAWDVAKFIDTHPRPPDPRLAAKH
ncbi:MAG: c-type cytochrome [Proteobacteria bacterium]|nr:c-type cytochrome [Pseudomonadota bacterium]